MTMFDAISQVRLVPNTICKQANERRSRKRHAVHLRNRKRMSELPTLMASAKGWDQQGRFCALSGGIACERGARIDESMRDHLDAASIAFASLALASVGRRCGVLKEFS